MFLGHLGGRPVGHVEASKQNEGLTGGSSRGSFRGARFLHLCGWRHVYLHILFRPLCTTWSITTYFVHEE